MRTPNTHAFDEILRFGAGTALIAVTVVVMAWLFSMRGPNDMDTAQIAETPQTGTRGLISSAQASIAPMPAMLPGPATLPMPAAGPATFPNTDYELPDEHTVQAAVPTWRRNAAFAPVPKGRPLVAIVIDDVGMTPIRAARAIALKAPVTLAFLPYAPGIAPMALEARRKGHEIMVHMPMEALDRREDPGPQALLTSLSPDALARRIDWNLSQIDGYVGLNNHMGSRFTADPAGMELVMHEVARRGLLYLDSRTTGDSRAPEIAARFGVPLLRRDVFLDNVVEPAAIRKQLETLLRVARRQGAAIAIGHPHASTLAVLERWLEEDHGVIFVPVSNLVDYDYATHRVAYDPAYEEGYSDSSGY